MITSRTEWIGARFPPGISADTCGADHLVVVHGLEHGQFSFAGQQYAVSEVIIVVDMYDIRCDFSNPSL